MNIYIFLRSTTYFFYKGVFSIVFFRKYFIWCTIFFAALFITSCKKESKVNNEIPKSGQVTNKGVELETPKVTMIGTDGGKVTSQDGLLEINIPAGALAGNTNISVAAITNTTASGIGLNYRLSPHLNFLQPVTLTFSYAAYEDSISMPAATGISFQDEKGVWQLKRKSDLDPIRKKISVQTTHFSDWAVTSLIRLSPRYSKINPNESVKITPYISVQLDTPKDIQRIFAPGGPDETLVLVEPYKLPSDFIVDIYLKDQGTTGSGTLINDDYVSIIFKASMDNSPVANPATVVFVLSDVDAVLTAKVKIISEEEGVFITMDGKEYVYPDAFATFHNGTIDIQFSAEHNGQTYYGSFAWKNSGTGLHHWNEDNLFNWEPEGFSPKRMFTSFRNDGMEISDGFIETYEDEDIEIGQLLPGMFSITNAGINNTESGNGEYMGDIKITGRFLVKRTY